MTPVDPPPADCPPPTYTVWIRLAGQPVDRWLVYGSGFACERQAGTLLAGVMEMGNGTVAGRVTVSGERPAG